MGCEYARRLQSEIIPAVSRIRGVRRQPLSAARVTSRATYCSAARIAPGRAKNCLSPSAFSQISRGDKAVLQYTAGNRETTTEGKAHAAYGLFLSLSYIYSFVYRLS